MAHGLPEDMGDIHEFIARLRARGFRIGVGEEARVLWVLDRLADSGDAPVTAMELGRWLGPICCTNAQQQATFADELRHWAGDTAEPGAARPVGARGERTPSPARALNRAGRTRRWTFVAGIVASFIVTLLVAAMWIVRPDVMRAALPPVLAPASAPAETVTIDPREELAWLRRAMPAVLPLLALGMFLMWQRRRPQVLARRFVARPMPMRQVALGAARRFLFAAGTLSREFQSLRRHHEVPSRLIDVSRSVRATVRNGGFVQLRAGSQRRLPDYLVLVDRQSSADHAGALADIVLRRLDEEQVPFSCQAFHGDPRRSRVHVVAGATGAGAPPGGTGRVADLADLAAVHGEHPLLLFTDAERFFLPDTEQLQPWVDQLLAWPLTLVFTPKPRAEWAGRERALQAVGVVVLPATPKGIGAFADLLLAGPLQSTLPSQGQGSRAPALDLHDLLQERPDRWVRQTAPSEREVGRLVAQLQSGLGQRAFELLCATAVVPSVSPEVTLWLAAELGGDASPPMLDEESFGCLSRLPWFRRGVMPDWLRLVLIGQLGEVREAEVRHLCLRLLRPHGEGNDRFDLDMARGEDAVWLSALLAVLRRDEASELRDIVFLGFMRRELPPALALATPGELSRLLRARGLGVSEWAAVLVMGLGVLLLTWHDRELLDGLRAAWHFSTGVAYDMQSWTSQWPWLVIGGTTASLTMWHRAIGFGPGLPAEVHLKAAWVLGGVAVLAALVDVPGGGRHGVLQLLASAAAGLLVMARPRVRSEDGEPVVAMDLVRGQTWISTTWWMLLLLMPLAMAFADLAGALVPEGLGSALRRTAAGVASAASAASAASPTTSESALLSTGIQLVSGVIAAVVMSILMVLPAASRLHLAPSLALSCAASALAANAIVMGLGVSVKSSLAAVTPSGVWDLALPLILSSAWGASLMLWHAGRVPAAWPVRTALATAFAALWVFGADFLRGTGALPAPAVGVVLTLPVLLLFGWIIKVEGDGALAAPSKGARTVAGLRSVVGAALITVWPLLSFAAGQPVNAPEYAYFVGIFGFLLLVPALRLAVPSLMAPLTAAAAEARRLSRRAWALMPLLWLLASSIRFGGFETQLRDLVVPIAAWWALRFGRHGWRPFLVGAAFLLASYDLGILRLGSSTPGHFFVAVIIYKLVEDARYRAETVGGGPVGWRQTLFLMLVAPMVLSYAVGPLAMGGGWTIYFTLLLLIVGRAGPPPAIGEVLMAGLGFGLLLRLALPNTDAWGALRVGYVISDPSVWIAAVFALHGPRWMGVAQGDTATLSSSAEVPGQKAGSAARSASAWARTWLPYIAVVPAFADVYFGLAVALSPRAVFSLASWSCLMTLAFLIGVRDGTPGIRRVAGLLGLLCAAVWALLVAQGTPNVRLNGLLLVSISAFDVPQGALIVAAFTWLGKRFSPHLQVWPPKRTLPRTVEAKTVPPQLRFKYMDLVLIALAAMLLAARVVVGIASLVVIPAS